MTKELKTMSVVAVCFAAALIAAPAIAADSKATAMLKPTGSKKLSVRERMTPNP